MSTISSHHRGDSAGNLSPGESRRYTGRASSVARAAPRAKSAPPLRLVGADSQAPGALVPRLAASGARARWSVRLAVALGALAALLIAARLPGLYTAPTTAATGVEATYAATANAIAGYSGIDSRTGAWFPPSAPWIGPAPANPNGSLPLYTWLSALLGQVAGPESWAARGAAIAFSLLAGLALFALVRRTAGARAALYALLTYAVAPLSVVLGQQISPSSSLMAAQALTLLLLVRWRGTVNQAAARGSAWAYWPALAAAGLYGLLDPGALWLALPAMYLIIQPSRDQAKDTGPLSVRTVNSVSASTPSLAQAWRSSPNRAYALLYLAVLAVAPVVWLVMRDGASEGLWLAAADGGTGVSGVLGALFSPSSYVSLLGVSVERILTVAGLLLFAAGLLHGARPPVPLLFHAWVAGASLHALFDAHRLPAHEDVLLPLLLPMCALVGIGAAWAGALPARLWLALTEQRRDPESEYAVSPHTSWLLDLPEERAEKRRTRPQAQLALGKSVAEKSQAKSALLRRTWWLALGHVGILALFAVVVQSGAATTLARLAPNERSASTDAIAAELAGLVGPGSEVVIAGPLGPELFYATRSSGWWLPPESYNLAEVKRLQRQGAGYLLSVDQEWLGKHPDYRGLITTYGIEKLSRGFILFDLNSKPTGTDRAYFLESGHTLGGAFRAFWERHGGVAKLGYPISEELVEKNPLDGQERKVQYFERAVLEYHAEFEGTPDAVMLASVGLWVTQGKVFQRAEPVPNSAERWYFAETGHIVKEAFLRYWIAQGGLSVFGYPISEELPEISLADGKVYTVQYFERARFEWHPTFAGTPNEVQLGLIGKQALEMPKR